MTELLNELNQLASQHTIAVGDPERLMDSMSQAIPDVQILREGPHNGMQAAHRSGGGSVWIEAVDWLPPGRRTKRFRKLAFTDDGCGMGPEELFEGIGWLSPRTGDSAAQERFGFGAKLAGLKVSPMGIEYVTWDGVHPPIRAVLYREGSVTRFRPIGRNGDAFVVVPRAKLPEQIRAAGHGTRLTLIGHHEEEDTFATMHEALGGKNRGPVRFLNSRYAAFPAGINLSTSTFKSSEKTEIDRNRSRDVAGLRAVCEEVAIESGTVEREGYRIRWFWFGDAKEDAASPRRPAPGRRFIHADNCVFQSVVAVSIEDREVPGLWEIYDLRQAQGGASLLDQFGLGGMSRQFAVIVEITERDQLGIEPNVERAGITSHGNPLPLVEWANDFRDTMPEEVLAIRERFMERRSDKSVADIGEQLNKAMEGRARLFAALIHPLARFRGSGVGASPQSGGSGNQRKEREDPVTDSPSLEDDGDTGEPSVEPKQKRRRPRPKPEDDGERKPRGEGIAPVEGGDGSLNVVAGFKDWAETDEEPPEDERIHAKWLPGTGIILVNFDSAHMLAEAALVLDGRTRVSSTLLRATKNLLATDHVERGATWINKVTLMENARDGRFGRRELSFADQSIFEVESINEWALTAASVAGDEERIKRVRAQVDRLYPRIRT